MPDESRRTNTEHCDQDDHSGMSRAARRDDLDVRNEALETHYIDQLELLEVRHRADEVVIPAPRGTPLAVRNQIAPLSARGTPWMRRG